MFEFIKEYAEIITAISSVFIALLALSFSIWQGKKQVKHNKLSVMPHLDIISFHDSESHIMFFRVDNNGVGPAIIDVIRITINENSLGGYTHESYGKFFTENGFPRVKYKLEFVSPMKGHFLEPGSKTELFKITPTTFDTNDTLQFFNFFKSVKIFIEYHSVYNQKFSESTI